MLSNMNLTISSLKLPPPQKKKIWIFSLSANKDKSSMLKMPILLHFSRGDNTLSMANSLFFIQKSITYPCSFSWKKAGIFCKYQLQSHPSIITNLQRLKGTNKL